MDLAEGVGESSSPRSFAGYDVRNEVYNRLIENGNVEDASNPGFRELLDDHFSRLPYRYGMDINMDRVEDVLIHQQLLTQAKDSTKRPAYHIRFLERLGTQECDNDSHQIASDLRIRRPNVYASDEIDAGSHVRKCHDSDDCTKLEDLNLDILNNSRGIGNLHLDENCIIRVESILIHEVIFSTIDKPKLLSQGSTFEKRMYSLQPMATPWMHLLLMDGL